MKNLSIKEPDREETPFGHIALAFSGGGFRASSFGLGVLSYLHQLQQENQTSLLENVTFISSASGGTIANAMYAQNSVAGKPFGEFYKNLFENMQGTVLLDNVFKILNEDSVWENRPDKKRNLINAFALAYDSILFKGSLLGELYSSDSPSHLEEVCFNATEFYRGLLFRQNIKMKEDMTAKDDVTFRYGNFAINLDLDIAGKLRLSDLLAASSCFPAGFEPIIFPDDFTYNNALTEEDNKKLTPGELLGKLNIQLREMDRNELTRLYGEEVVNRVILNLPENPDYEVINRTFASEKIVDGFKFGMMDGGITDNQALESILDAQERRLKRTGTSFSPFDLMLINDVGSDFMDPYKPAQDSSSYTGIKGITINTLLLILSVLCLIGLAGVAVGFFTNFATELQRKVFVLAGAVISLLCALGLSLLLFVRSYIKGNVHNIGGLDLNKNFSGSIVNNLFDHFGKTPVGVILRMLKDRISSVLLLNNDVFLKRIRYLLYNAAYNSKRYQYRIMTNHVYDLSFSNDSKRDEIAGAVASKSMKVVAQVAFEMRSTLWFDTMAQRNLSQAALIACGQFTTCYNLLKYIHLLKYSVDDASTYYSKLSSAYQMKVDFLEEELKKDFERFKSDPFWLYNVCGESFGIVNFEKCDASKFENPEKFKRLR